MNTLNEYSVAYKHLQIKEPEKESGKETITGKLLKVYNFNLGENMDF